MPAWAQNLDPNLTPFPRASQADFSDLVPAPAGQNGFLNARDGHFYWQNGQRAKFWGINVANASLMESDENIEAMLHTFRAAGFNLVRLHHFDERNGILDLNADTSDQFIASRLKKLDFWIAKARENGLYIYLSLLDYRRFKSGDGVPNAEAIGRAAKPYAVFDPRLIELQKEYARKLLRDHKNFYSGLAYADDPTVVMVEIANENGLFIRRGYWRSMPPPYGAEFQKLWNVWLREKYRTTDALRAAWTEADGQFELSANEDLEAGTVELPALTWETGGLSETDLPFAALLRRSDGARFAAEIHRRYFRAMKAFLRDEVGLKVPVCATGRFDDLAETWAQTRELDFIAPSFYYDHPYWAKGSPQWQLPSYFQNTNPIADLSKKALAAQIGLSRVRGKPLVLREWNYCWPNPYRGAGVLEAATLAAYQDIDALILFTYETGARAKVGYFSVRSDPARWQMAAAGAHIFLGGLVAPAQTSVVIPWSQHATFDYQPYHHPFYNLVWNVRVENDFFEGDNYKAPAGTDLVAPLRRDQTTVFSGAPVYSSARMNAGTAINILKSNGKAVRSSANQQVFFSDSGEIIRNSPGGRFSLNASQVQVFAGDLKGVSGFKSGLGLKNILSGAIVAVALDGLPLVKSRRYVIKMTADARNSNEKIRRDPRFQKNPSGQWQLDDYGDSPVTTNGVATQQPVQVFMAGQPLLNIWLNGGSWELFVAGDERRFYCDTPGVRYQLSGQAVTTVPPLAVSKTK